MVGRTGAAKVDGCSSGDSGRGAAAAGGVGAYVLDELADHPARADGVVWENPRDGAARATSTGERPAPPRALQPPVRRPGRVGRRRGAVDGPFASGDRARCQAASAPSDVWADPAPPAPTAPSAP